MNQTPPKLIYIVVISLAVLAFTGLGSLCATMFWKNYVDPTILTAIITLTGTVAGSLGSILSAPRSAVTSTVTTTDDRGKETTTTQPVMLAPVPTATSVPAPVVVTNAPSDPVPTSETKE